MLKKVKNTLYMFYKAGDNLVDHDGIELAGYLSFLTLLAFFPFLVFLFAILGTIGETQLGTYYISMLVENAPQRVLNALLPRITEIVSGPPPALLTISILGAIWTASSIVEGARTVLNRAYHVKTPPNYYWRRSISIIQMIALTIFLIIVMMGLVFAPIVFGKVTGFFASLNAASVATGGNEVFAFPLFPFFNVEWEMLRKMVAVAAVLFFVSMLYYILPNVKQKWVRTLPGALIVVLGWLLVAKGYTYYLLHYNQMNLIYGSLANIIAFLVFFYIQNIVFIYGAEFNYLLEKALGHKIEQKEEVVTAPLAQCASPNEVNLVPQSKKAAAKIIKKKKLRKKQSDKNKDK